jgi:NAD(P)-dependent dehydrogenase (short-subunit alcohol dehydrogenase family)
MTMHIRQKSLNSGFGARTSADDVLAGIDLAGRHAIVTGGHSGLGLETTRVLVAAGAKVIVASRDPASSGAAVGGLGNVMIEKLDLSDLDSVGLFANRVLAAGLHIDILINNSGIMAVPERRVGNGWESQFATNHLGHFVLTSRLWPALEGGARVVSVWSAGHHLSPIRWNDVQFERGYDKWLAYAQAKTANALLAVHLDRIGSSHGIRALSLHPGKIFTPLQRYLTTNEMVTAGWIDETGAPVDPTFKTVQQGAATTLWAATSPLLDGLGGLYCEDCDVAKLVQGDDGAMTGVRDYAIDPDEAERLWSYSTDLLKGTSGHFAGRRSPAS